MELFISVAIMATVIFLSAFFLHRSETKKATTLQAMMSIYEQTCKDHCTSNREVTEQFMKASKEQTGSIVALHKKTLELLSGEKLDDV